MKALALQNPRVDTALWVGGIAAAAVLAAAALAVSPWLAMAAVGGAFVLLFVLARPLALVGVMLAVGPIDLSFLTGGFKGLLTEAGGIDMNGVRLVGITAGLTAIALVDRNVVRHVFEKYGRWYLLFLVYGAATLALSVAPVMGLRLLFKIAYPFLVFIAVLGVARSLDDLDRLINWTLAGAAVIALILNPLYLMAGGYELDIDGRIRVWGVGTHENPFSFYLLMMVLFSLTRYAVRKQSKYLVLAGVLGVWMVLTLTRITFGASLFALTGLGVYGAWRGRNIRVLLGALAIAGGVALALTPIVLERTLGFVPGPAELIEMVRDPMGLYEAMNWQGREMLWPFILAALMASPLVGLGLGSTGPLLETSFPKEIGLVVHNEYIRLAAETGIIGGVLYFIAIMAWFRAVLRAAAVQHPRVREFAYPAIAGILAWSVIAITDNAFDYYAPFTQYIGLACAGAIASARFVTAEQAQA